MAQHNLGAIYFNGHGVSQDFQQAAQWYEKAAAQGDPFAQNDLGYLYVDGKGIPKDEKKGIEWIQKSAEKGNAYGQDSLGEMYRDGRGVQQDNVRAYMWFDLAAARSVGTGVKFAVEHRNEIGARMTPAQIAEAKRLSQQCQARQFKGC